jgi:UDP-glucose 4-epimerase
LRFAGSTHVGQAFRGATLDGDDKAPGALALLHAVRSPGLDRIDSSSTLDVYRETDALSMTKGSVIAPIHTHAPNKLLCETMSRDLEFATLVGGSGVGASSQR